MSLHKATGSTISGEVIPWRGMDAPTPQRGRHGMTARQKYTQQDWITWGTIGGVNDHEYRIVDVAPWSAAWTADIRSGDWVLSIDGMGFDAFERRGGLAGAIVTVVTYRPDLGTRSIRFELGMPARPKPPTKQHKPVYPQVACGAVLVSRNERPKWLKAMVDDPALIARDRDVAARLATRYADDENKAWPSIATMARDLRISETSVKRARAILQYRGWLKVFSGCHRGTSNVYWLTWPAGRTRD